MINIAGQNLLILGSSEIAYLSFREVICPGAGGTILFNEFWRLSFTVGFYYLTKVTFSSKSELNLSSALLLLGHRGQTVFGFVIVCQGWSFIRLHFCHVRLSLYMA